MGKKKCVSLKLHYTKHIERERNEYLILRSDRKMEDSHSIALS